MGMYFHTGKTQFIIPGNALVWLSRPTPGGTLTRPIQTSQPNLPQNSCFCYLHSCSFFPGILYVLYVFLVQSLLASV
jgi:hypothetical protein